MRLYLAGPMTGLPLWNFPAFAVAAAALRSEGHTVLSPAEHDRELGWSPFGEDPPTEEQLEKMFQWDLAMISAGPMDMSYSSLIRNPVDAVALLPGWARSPGAKLEALVAQKCGRKLYRFEFENDPGGPQGLRFLREIHPPTLEARFVGEELAGSAERDWS